MFSTTLRVDCSLIEAGKGSNSFTNNSCLLGFLFNKIFIFSTLV